MQTWRPWPAGWRPDPRTVGLVVLVLFLVSAVDTLLFADAELSGALAGHPPGLSSAQASALSLFPVRDRVIDGLAFLIGVISVVGALGGLAMVRGWRPAATVIAAVARSICLIELTTLVLHTPPVRYLVSSALFMAVLLLIVVTTIGLARTTVPSMRVRSYPAGPYAGKRSTAANRDALDDDETARATIEGIWPGATEPVGDDQPLPT